MKYLKRFFESSEADVEVDNILDIITDFIEENDIIEIPDYIDQVEDINNTDKVFYSGVIALNLYKTHFQWPTVYPKNKRLNGLNEFHLDSFLDILQSSSYPKEIRESVPPHIEKGFILISTFTLIHSDKMPHINEKFSQLEKRIKSEGYETATNHTGNRTYIGILKPGDKGFQRRILVIYL